MSAAPTYEQLVELIERLTAEAEGLRAEVGRLGSENARLVDEIAGLRRRLGQDSATSPPHPPTITEYQLALRRVRAGVSMTPPRPMCPARVATPSEATTTDTAQPTDTEQPGDTERLGDTERGCMSPARSAASARPGR